MIIFEESLYGWGVCNIPMPRSSFDIFLDRRKKDGRRSIFERNRQSELPGILSSISGIVANDVPWLQTATLSFLALLSILLAFFLSNILPEIVEEEPPEPIEITIELAREPIKKSAPVVPAVPKPIRKETTVEEKLFLKKPVVKERPSTEQTPFEIKTKPLPKEAVPEEILPQIKIKPRTKKPLKSQETFIPRVSTLEKIKKPEDVTISVSVAKKEKYNTDRAREKELQLDSTSGFISKRPNDQSVIDVAKTMPQKNYKVSTKDQAVVLPSSKTALISTTADVQIVADLTAKEFNKNYTVNKKEPSVVVAPENTTALLTQPDVPVSKISPATDLKKNYKAEVKDHGKVVLSDTTEPILMRENVPDATIIPVTDIQKNYNVDKEKQVVTVPVDNSDLLIKDPDAPAVTIDSADLTQKNYKVNPEDKSMTIPSASDDSLLTHPSVLAEMVDPLEKSQKNYNIEDLNPDMAKTNDNQSISFDNVEMEDIDPSHLISLKQLAVCADPEEEFYHKTKLATLLREPVRCEANGMLLFFKYPESGYTLRVEIYNPGGTVLKDRCSVLRLAVECVNDQKAKGVIP